MSISYRDISSPPWPHVYVLTPLALYVTGRNRGFNGSHTFKPLGGLDFSFLSEDKFEGTWEDASAYSKD